MKTLRIAIVAAFVIVFINCVQSQTLYWLRAGGSYDWVSGLNTEFYTSRTGYEFGGGIEKIISNPIGIKAELLYKKKGFSSFKEQHLENSYRLWQNDVDQIALSIPLISTLNFKRCGFDFGLYLDYLLQTKQYELEATTYFDDSNEIRYEFLNRDKFRSPELGFIVGGNVEIFGGLFFSARFVQGFTSLGESYAWKRNSSFHVSLSKRIGSGFSPKPLAMGRSIEDAEIKSSYRVLNQQNITRINFHRLYDGEELILRWAGAEGGSLQISDISIMHSSGHQTISANEVRISNVVFPVNLRVRYSVRNVMSGNTYNSQVDIEINDAGAWNIILNNN
jgi:hypothetical protein